ncbi:asparagine--tRNA ligase SLM5 KNAG_0I00470 [Huiozyma naganishii CBS 8797]|uniref:asparagine--tRNA ligase n=1 Tax=Huiozyma naganishii (strain ATCC MYA-139 / BCRC 22969 / CBS 8797 / KCTC 17520 / NBRC 10181 / NCYC 3082 / Yp74L-3) TaxID=1071383 RepID=J7RQ00_HUIN7|nr:hypothetical protein KNAG_0I00470 [Kazachstania naganishii CBS 8797]CCK71838.1 hypothetical protein KNAG_0I00470 [Kazachstania naganishii CBS 8797]
MPCTVKQLYAQFQRALLSNNTVSPIVNGYISNITRLKNVSFININDGTTSQPLKLVLKNKPQDALRVGQTVQLESGHIVLTPTRPQPFEISVDSLRLLGNVPDNFPLQQKQLVNLAKIRSKYPLWKFKYNKLAQILRFRSSLELSLANKLDQIGFTKVDAPLLTNNDTEGHNETFKVSAAEWNSKNINLTVSTQLHLEVLAQSLSNVYALSPCFRAEGSDTGRHLAEFWMLELESTNWGHLPQLISGVQDLLIQVVQNIPQNIRDEFKEDIEVQERWGRITNENNWHQVEYRDVIKELQNNKHLFQIAPPTEHTFQTTGISSEHEKWIAEKLFNNGYVFIKNYPKSLKPFYMKPNSDDTVQCFDLIFPQIAEVIGGSVREDLPASLKDLPRDLDWYRELRTVGYRPTGGFGLGLERFIAYLLNIPNVKDTVPFYRVMNSEIVL